MGHEAKIKRGWADTILEGRRRSPPKEEEAETSESERVPETKATGTLGLETDFTEPCRQGARLPPQARIQALHG